HQLYRHNYKINISLCLCSLLLFFFFTDTAPSQIYTLSLHDALPISTTRAITGSPWTKRSGRRATESTPPSPSRKSSPRSRCRCRSEEHTSELQSRFDLVCRLLLEKKKKQTSNTN